MAPKTYTITEYGSFFCPDESPSAPKTDFGSYKVLPREVFNKLERFVLENAEKGTEAANVLGFSIKKHIGRVITAKNHVGVIALDDGNVIEILPKICGQDDEGEVKKLLIKMLRTVHDSPFKSLQPSSVNTDTLPIFEIFIGMFITETFAVVKRGLKSGYESVEDNLTVCKGKLDFRKQVLYNFVHKERFFVAYDEFNNNRPENKLIKSTLQYLLKHSRSVKNKADLKVLLNVFENVDVSVNYDADFARCVSDRQSQSYQTLLAWCRVFLKGKSFTSFAGSEVAYALLFPMEKVFESYVAMQLKRQLNGTEYTVSTQHKAKHLFDTPKKFSLQPDIVVTKQTAAEKAIFILDTKWKRLNNDPKVNYGISQADMYQMYVYQKKYGAAAQSVTLLYPLTDNVSETEFTDEDGVRVRVLFVDLKDEGLATLADRLKAIF